MNVMYLELEPTRVGKAGLAAPGEHVPGAGRGGCSPGLGGVEGLPGERRARLLVIGGGVLLVDGRAAASPVVGAAEAAIMLQSSKLYIQCWLI